MKKNELQTNDLLIFKNGHTAILDYTKLHIIEQFYDNELNCLSNDDYTIVKVYRPTYDLVFNNDNNKLKIK